MSPSAHLFLKCFSIEDFDQEEGFNDMQTLLCLAHPRPCTGLSSTDMIEHMAMIEFLQPLSGRCGHRFSGAEHPFNVEARWIDTHVFCLFGDMKSVGWGVHHGVRLDLNDLVDSSLRVEGTSRDDFTAEFLRGVMSLPEGHIHVVPKGEKDPVMGPKACHVKDVTPHLNPPLPAFIRLRHVNRFSGRSTRLPERGDVLDRNPQGAPIGERVTLLIFSQLFLVRQGDLFDVVECCDVVRLDAFQFLLVENRMRLCVGENISEVGELYFTDASLLEGFLGKDSSISSSGTSYFVEGKRVRGGSLLLHPAYRRSVSPCWQPLVRRL